MNITLDFADVFAATPGPYLLLAPAADFTIIGVNEAYLAATLTTREKLIGRPLFEAFPDNPSDSCPTGVKNLRASLELVQSTGKPHTMAVQKYDIRRPDGSFEERFWSPVNTPVLGKEGNVICIIHHVQDVTSFVRLKQSAADPRKSDGPLAEAEQRLQATEMRTAEFELRLEAEKALGELSAEHARQLRLFEQISSTTPDFIYVFDRDGRFRYANRRLLEVWGKTFEEAVGKNLYELGYPRWHADMHMRELQQVMTTKKPIMGEVPFTGGSGIFGVYEYIFTPVLGPDGEVEVIAGTTRDVTQRKRAQRLVAAQNRALELVATDAPLSETLAVLTKVVEELADNQSVAAILLVTREGLLKTGAAPSLPPDFNAAVDTIKVSRGVGTCADAAARGESVCTPDIENAASWQGLSHLPAAQGLKAAWSMPIRGTGGRILGTFGTYFRECREPTQAEKEVVEGLCRLASLAIERSEAAAAREELLASERAARGDAERASRMKDEFLATLSHELRTPLNAILGWSQILKRHGGHTEDVAEGIEVIERNARAQTQIIEDLLDMSRIISGKVRLEVQRVDLAAALRAAIETVTPAAQAKGVRVQAVLDSLAGPVMGDLGRLQQVFWNLLSNAVKFTPRDGRVQVLLERVNSHLEVSVIDSGEGITPEFLPHVFDRFRQADASTTRKHGGLGLGLAIVKQLAELHGGSVRAKSPGPGKGSTFTVMLPLAPLEEKKTSDPRRHPAADEKLPPPADGEPVADISGMRVLVVDDEPDSRAMMKRMLEEQNANVILAASAAEALELLKRHRPDLLVSDIGMPGEDGYALMRRVRSLAPDHGGQTPAVALTAFARVEDRMKAVMAGFQHHVAKPVEPAELIAMMASLRKRGE
ncbi:MAG: ATP-binding protein [Phycisphaerae bacterium]